MSTAPAPQGNAMYVASQSNRDWLLDVQRKLYARSYENPQYVFCKLWGLVTDPRNLRVAMARVASNRGRRTAGVDGVTVKQVLATQGPDAYLADLRRQLRDGSYAPSPARRVLIPKPGQPGKFRPLGIPTVTDRVVQAAVKNILEPVFEADFHPSSFGFRPCRSAHEALEKLRLLLQPQRVQSKSKAEEPRLPYQWAIEGDIKGCFDNIGHHGLMQRVRRRIGDTKVTRLVLAFLKAGVLSEEQFLRTETGTPQGGILSPLLANIALAALDEQYERWVWPRRGRTLLQAASDVHRRASKNREWDRSRRPVFVPVRYADDFIILVSAPPGAGQKHAAQKAALQEKAMLAQVLDDELGLRLSEEKTLLTPVTAPMRFLGHHLRVQYDPKMSWSAKVVIPRDRTTRLRAKIRQCFGATDVSLKHKLNELNSLLQGWSAYYRHARGAKRVFSSLDHHVWQRTQHWLRRKHEGIGMKRLLARYGWRKPNGRGWRWCDGSTKLYEMAEQRTGRYRFAWSRTPSFASTPMESPVLNERRTSGLVRGARKPAGASRARRRAPI